MEDSSVTEELEDSKPVDQLSGIRVLFHILAMTFGMCIRLGFFLLGLACIALFLNPFPVLSPRTEGRTGFG